MERFTRRRMVKGAVVGTFGVALSPLLVGCGVTVTEPGTLDLDMKIQDLQVVLDDTKKNFPECVVDDVNQELLFLAVGVDTYNPRALSSNISEISRMAIFAARRSMRRDLQERAGRIISITPDKNPRLRSLLLAAEYNVFAQGERAGIDAFSDSDEMRKEMIYLASCHLAKSITLAYPYNIADLRQKNIIP